MGLICKLFKYFLLGLIAFIAYRMYPCFMKCGQQPNFDSMKLDGWFGIEKLKANQKIPIDPVKIQPFQLNVSQADLEDLRQRLQRSRFIDHLVDTNFHYGFNSDYLKQIQQYWLQKYDWRKFEHQINSFPQFLTKIEGLDIHFLHVKPKPSNKVKTIVPILLLHGWPGSFWENVKMIPMLLEPDSKNGLAFEMIIPSIPGYGYSEAPHQPNFDIASAARIFTKLMKRLGHEKYFIHGGDWGNAISHAMGKIYPENTRGVHLVGAWFQPSKPCDYFRMALAYFFPNYYFESEPQKQWSKMFPFGEKFKKLLKETGYMHLQATRPDTIGSALVDSPIGLAAYILEKFSVWTDSDNLNHDDGKLTKKFTMDDLLTNLMIYWTSGNIASSQRFYYENFMNSYDNINKFITTKLKVPASVMQPVHDLQSAPRKFIEPTYENLLQFTETKTGGHFLAMEEPKLVSDDLRLFVEKVLKLEEEQKKKEEEEAAAKKKKHDEI